MTKPKMREVSEPDMCGNCCHLAWGKEQGWDCCAKHDFEIYWAAKSHQICDDHERSLVDLRGKHR